MDVPTGLKLQRLQPSTQTVGKTGFQAPNTRRVERKEHNKIMPGNKIQHTNYGHTNKKRVSSNYKTKLAPAVRCNNLNKIRNV